jgi:hypothetical protein
MQSNAAVTNDQDQEPLPATKCGNVWLVAATVAQSLVQEHPGAVHVLTMDAEGNLAAFAPDHPDYERSLLSSHLVGTLNQRTDMQRLAGRIRDAAVRQAQPR